VLLLQVMDRLLAAGAVQAATASALAFRSQVRPLCTAPHANRQHASR
jgi:hypothetical protein